MPPITQPEPEMLTVEINGHPERFEWRSENGSPIPSKLELIDDTCAADHALRLASAGTSLLWNGDFQNARHLLQAMARRLDKRIQKRGANKLKPSPSSLTSLTSPKLQVKYKNHKDHDLANQRSEQTSDVMGEGLRGLFDEFREHQRYRAQILGRLLIPVSAEHTIKLKRAPDISNAYVQAYGSATQARILSLRELQGIISAYEWRKKGVEIDLRAEGLGSVKITPHYGVFSPIRGEYLRLVASSTLPQSINSDSSAFDIGTGTGVLALILARKGIQNIVATDQSSRAIACATENIQMQGSGSKIDVRQENLYPKDPLTHQNLKASLIICNPPWLPGPSSGALDSAVYDPGSQMLKGFLTGLGQHLHLGGEGWLIMSDLAEHLGLRSRAELMQWIDAAGLEVLAKTDVRPEHKKARDSSDPFFKARSSEVTSLWRLGVRK